MIKKRLLILGVTASGKSGLAFQLAQRVGAEIISVDSMKVYRRMDIGTAKPSLDARTQIPYHLVDVVEPSKAFSVGMFYDQALQAARTVESRGKSVIAVGGTALYIKSLLYGLFDGPEADEDLRRRLREKIDQSGLQALHQDLKAVDPSAAERINPNDERRIIRALEVFQLTGKPISQFQKQFDAPHPSTDWLVVGLRRGKDQESRRINARVKRMIDRGLVAEVQSLVNESLPLSKQAGAAIGYAEILAHINGDLDLDQAIEKIKINTRRLAKHQRTWFRTFPQVQWIEPGPEDGMEQVIKQVLELWDSEDSGRR